jgi:hypothetical protein
MNGIGPKGISLMYFSGRKSGLSARAVANGIRANIRMINRFMVTSSSKK